MFVSQNKDPSINALIDWDNYLFDRGYQKNRLSVKYREGFHYSFNLSCFSDNGFSFKPLIFKLLMVDPNHRLDITGVLKLLDFKLCENKFINPLKSKLNEKIHKKIKEKMSSILKDDLILDLAVNLYFQIYNIIHMNDQIKMVACLWIFHKIVYKKDMFIDTFIYKLTEILEAERYICNYLSYRLY